MTERTLTVLFNEKKNRGIEELATVKYLLHKGHHENALILLLRAVEFLTEALIISHQQIEQLQDHTD